MAQNVDLKMIALDWKRRDGAYVHPQFGAVLKWADGYYWQPPQRPAIRINARSLTEACGIVIREMPVIFVGSQYRPHCVSCDTRLRSWDTLLDAIWACAMHLSAYRSHHPGIGMEALV